MFPFPIAKPQKCDIQTFYGALNAGSANQNARIWNKPVGVSHVYMMLIGGGADGTGTSGGGSGAVTVWYGAAQHVPESILILCSGGQGQDTFISYRGNSLVPILSAAAATNATGAAASVAGPFAASGFYKSTAGQNGSTTTIAASTTTFLSGGAQSTGSDVVANYGYDSTAVNAQGYFQMQPIIVGVGASGGSIGGIGCGGGGSLPGIGGPGMVLIASW